MVDVRYVVVLSGVNPCMAMVPDFSLMASGVTREEALLSVQKLVLESVEVAKRYGTDVPKSTPDDLIRNKWVGDDYSFSSVVVRV